MQHRHCPWSQPSAVDDAASGKVKSAPDAATSEDVSGSPDAVVWLCELVLQELVRVGSPGSSSLDTSEGRVRAYVAELCKARKRWAGNIVP